MRVSEIRSLPWMVYNICTMDIPKFQLAPPLRKRAFRSRPGTFPGEQVGDGRVALVGHRELGLVGIFDQPDAVVSCDDDMRGVPGLCG